MENWQEDLFSITTDDARSEQDVFGKMVIAAHALGFTHCAYGMWLPTPFSNPKIVMLNNYDAAWQSHYATAGYLQIDPTVLHGRRSQIPQIWTDHTFAEAPHLWDDARASGLRVGWAQSTLNAIGVGGMLTLSRSAEDLSEVELATKEVKMRWLANVVHSSLSRIFTAQRTAQIPKLTAREVEVLKWTADGKTSGEISDLLSVSDATVNFHVKNAVTKLQTANKTAAVVRAAMLGMLG